MRNPNGNCKPFTWRRNGSRRRSTIRPSDQPWPGSADDLAEVRGWRNDLAAMRERVATMTAALDELDLELGRIERGEVRS
jgi:hypothetical protein